MRAEEFIDFLEKEKLKSIIYKRLKWRESYIPKSSEELNALIYEFGRLKIIWWMPSVADCSKGKRFAKGQVVLALFFIGLSSCCLSKEYRLMSALCLVALSCYVICSFLLYARYITDYVDIYKGEIMPFFSYTGVEECVEGDYIESIKGIVSSAEFSMHVCYLLNMEDEGYEDDDGIYHTGFNDYVSQLRSSNRFKTELEKSVIEKFLSYVEVKRKDRKGFEQDIRSLRFCDERNDEQGIKKAYEKLFRCTKKLLWHIEPYKLQDDKPIDVFYKRVKHLNENLSLEKSLERVCILYDNPDQILRELKGLLVMYHPDKNIHEDARKIYEKVELVYKAVSTILKGYERHFGDTIFCNFKMFLGKKLQDIDENSVYEEIVSTYKILRMKEYSKKKDNIANIRDEMLEKYRVLIYWEDIILEKRITYPNPKRYKGTQEKKTELKEEYKDQEKTIRELSKRKKEIIEELENLSKKLGLEIEEMSEICSTIKERCNNEIERQSLVFADNAFSKYYHTRQVKEIKV
ncbi:flagellar basal body-associated FliL family protein [Wolbachia endosymbiont (group A) of Epagoge grotiana]|uniref:hypothetical protein n=1 Tax=Wolbachia endosymbiont (group A) of Epagoge grotiana TaxID=2954006 RepID=UPI00222E217D|nr:hypothetical protein [Wolbachia endosymbiont (group A) of Epagoge grotiana]